jgi:Mrp family chromosome partitioning ATPase
MAALFRAARKRSLSHVPQPQLLELVSLHSEPAPPRRSELPREIEHGETETPALLEPPPTPVSIIAEGDVIALSSRLRDRRRPDSGYRTLITGKRESIDVTAETTELVNALAHRGAEVILIDWSPSGEGMAESVGLDCSVGLNDLLRGEVNFGEIIQRLPGTSVHAIAAGKALDLSPETINSDQLNLVLDALDEAYDHIIVSSRHDEARELFGMIEGRFDTGVIVVEPCKEAPIIADPEGTFLGFEVADIDIVRFERRAWGRAAVHQRIARVTQRRSPELARRA